MRLHSILPIVVAIALAPAPGHAPEGGPDKMERRAKISLLYRFISYIEWPPQARPLPEAPFVIGVLGAQPLAEELESYVVGRAVSSRPILVRRIRTAAAAREVHALFIDRSESAQLPAAARAGGHVLLVTEWPDALEQGSVINFRTVGGEVRFEISLPAAQERQLQVSSRLLSVSLNAPQLKP